MDPIKTLMMEVFRDRRYLAADDLLCFS